jgi:two-component system, chemotaxis family, chemotaxis protein CheY
MTKILVVDDSAVIRKVARRILERLGFEVDEAENGRKALDCCAENMPDAVLLDWNMPVMDGIQFLRELRKTPEGARPKVIFCTTENDVSQIARAVHAGADGYILKPFDKEILAAKFEDMGFACS